MRAALPLFLTVSLLVFSVVGCTERRDEAPPVVAPMGTAPPAGSAPAVAATGNTALAAGEAVYQKNGCGNCHLINGKGGRSGPELSHVGAEAEHTSEWLIAHVKNPRAHHPKSTMPAFADKITDDDLLTLGAYLASLK